MKRLVMLVSTSAVFALSSLPALAADVPDTQKDECLLAAQNCANQVDDIYARIHKLEKAIKKGDKVYSAAELKALQAKLQEANQLLMTLEKAE
ncbi:hypothetical protein [Geomonas sp.]|uniref:hypothetical protein n=1 Tax=Geomonas sp. TaxID=2651584 RepID=UPI002B467C21|nr:hypothetical protein [Geomonas sp.]HJV33786.1 hypothetical protein [Geomonas sp.]